MEPAPKNSQGGLLSNSSGSGSSGTLHLIHCLALSGAGFKKNYGLHSSAILAWRTLSRSWNDPPWMDRANWPR
jgi:hypothetical protein